MTESLVHTEIDRLLESLSGELTSHSRVIDALLDVRGASDNAELIALVDASLRNIPGKNAAETDWLRKQLAYFGLMFEVSTVASPDPTAV